MTHKKQENPHTTESLAKKTTTTRKKPCNNNNNQKKTMQQAGPCVHLCGHEPTIVTAPRIIQYNRSVTHCGMVDRQDDGLDSHMHFPNHCFIL